MKDKSTNNDLEYITQKTKDCTQGLRAPEE